MKKNEKNAFTKSYPGFASRKVTIYCKKSQTIFFFIGWSRKKNPFKFKKIVVGYYITTWKRDNNNFSNSFMLQNLRKFYIIFTYFSQLKGYLRYKSIFCYKVDLDAQLMNFLFEIKMFRSRYI